jgi:SAM-dependent methyltransferase
MCDHNCIDFIRSALPDVRGKRVLEVRAFDDNGSARPFLEAQGPSHYLGVDLRPGPCVDVICDVCDLLSRFGAASFDIVFTTEMLEHVQDWRCAIDNLKSVLCPGGQIALTTRSIGFPYHEHPGDYWRYEPEDLKAIFQDFEYVVASRLPNSGVALFGTKPSAGWRPADLSRIELYSMAHD